jgi:DNA-binding CsgD family transcriptional regulator
LGTTTECAVRGSGTIGQMSIANRRFDASVICRSAFAVPKLADEELEEDLVPFSPVIVPGILLLVAIGFAVDLVLDRPSSWLSLHVMVELMLMVVSLTFSIILWRALQKTTRHLQAVEGRLAASAAERDAWKQSAEAALAGFSAAVDSQFVRWKLTPAERDIALLLLQGLGHKQIAARTSRSERTVRQHAVSIYQKSGLGGRAELAAFFLEGVRLNMKGTA